MGGGVLMLIFLFVLQLVFPVTEFLPWLSHLWEVVIPHGMLWRCNLEHLVLQEEHEKNLM